MRENWVLEIHQEINFRHKIVRDSTHRNSSTQIDIVFAIQAITQYISRSKIIYFNKIIITDYRGFIFDIHVKKLFKMKTSN